MKKVAIRLIMCIAILIFVAGQIGNAASNNGTNNLSDIIIAMEKAALERWNNGDPSGYLDIYADEITYFDESSPARLDGYDTLKKRYDPLKGKIYNDHFEMLNPKVQLHENTGILTFNLLNYSKEGKVTSRWNCTEVYSKLNGAWKIIHSHWSYTKHKEQEN